MARLFLILTVFVSACGAVANVRDVGAAASTVDTRACRSAVAADGAPARVPVDWRVPDERGVELAAWCAAVGPAVIEAPRGDRLRSASPAFQPSARSAAPDPAATGVTVVSWNTHVDGGDLRSLVDTLRAGELTGGRPVAHFVLLLQEAYRAGTSVPEIAAGTGFADRIDEDQDAANRDIVSVAQALGLWLFYVPSMRNGADAAEDRGNAILSTLPLSAFTVIELPFERQRRVAVAAQVRVPWDGAAAPPVRVASAHLDATAGARRLKVFASGLRARQASHLAAALDDGVPTILGADLNTWAGGASERAYRLLEAAFPQSPRPGLRPTSSAGFLLDYLLVRGPADWRVESERVTSRFGSDHHPLVATVAIRRVADQITRAAGTVPAP